MTLTFRHLGLDPSAPVESWPVEALQTALARGGLGDWRRIVAAIRRDPWGPVARTVEHILTYDRPYGVAELMETAIGRAREAAQAQERAAVATELRDLLAASGLTRTEFASRLGTSRTRLATYLAGSVVPSAALLVRARRVAGA